ACPTTEADLGDGFLPALRVRHRGIPLCIGSDSNVRIDPFEELRQLEGIARRQDGRRNVFSTDERWAIGGANGAASLALDGWGDLEVDLDHRSLAGVAEEHVPAALVAGCGADVVVDTPGGGGAAARTGAGTLDAGGRDGADLRRRRPRAVARAAR